MLTGVGFLAGLWKNRFPACEQRFAVFDPSLQLSGRTPSSKKKINYTTDQNLVLYTKLSGIRLIVLANRFGCESASS